MLMYLIDEFVMSIEDSLIDGVLPNVASGQMMAYCRMWPTGRIVAYCQMWPTS